MAKKDINKGLLLNSPGRGEERQDIKLVLDIFSKIIPNEKISIDTRTSVKYIKTNYPLKISILYPRIRLIVDFKREEDINPVIQLSDGTYIDAYRKHREKIERDCYKWNILTEDNYKIVLIDTTAPPDQVLKLFVRDLEKIRFLSIDTQLLCKQYNNKWENYYQTLADSRNFFKKKVDWVLTTFPGLKIYPNALEVAYKLQRRGLDDEAYMFSSSIPEKEYIKWLFQVTNVAAQQSIRTWPQINKILSISVKSSQKKKIRSKPNSGEVLRFGKSNQRYIEKIPILKFIYPSE